MDELSVLTAEARAKLLAELRIAEAEIASGQFVEYDPEAFVQRLLSIYRGKNVQS
jgi:hypothetical protein